MYLNNNPHDSFFVFYKKKCVKSIRWNPDAIVFNSWQHYGCPNYWMLHFFKDSSGATLHPTTIQASNYGQLVASAITWQNGKDKSTYLRIKVNHRLIALLPCFPRSRGKKGANVDGKSCCRRWSISGAEPWISTSLWQGWRAA